MPRATHLLSTLLFGLLAVACSGETSAPTGDAGATATAASDGAPPLSVSGLKVEAACGQCQFGMQGGGCDLAVRLPAAASFFVDGTAIDEHGDAHGDDGFCNTVRHAVISGETVDGRMLVSAFELLPIDTEG